MAWRSTSTPPSIMTRCVMDCSVLSACWNSDLCDTASRMLCSISGSRRSASARVKRLAMRVEARQHFVVLNARHLDGHRTAARTVKLGQDDALPGAQQHGGIADLQA